LGVIGASVQGWCTITGHRQMGMVFDIVVAGATASPGTGQGAGHNQHGSMGASDAPVTADPSTPLSTHIDPVLAPLSDERVHRVTLTVEEVALEVAPGVWQKRWTYNGNSVGPTLHGRVGDTFEITLVNNGSMGHSIDFHASAVAPDEPMRTIPPGESLVYTFTANRSGIWMYHCSTMPMSSHIAAGMHGAVIIEPEGLPEVDRSYVVVQSEVYLGEGGTDASNATEVDAAQATAAQPDKVVFNGIANQYDQFPFQARVGERVRFWVLDAGPNLASSFHIVGGQFDTVYFEGGYQLLRGADAFGQTGGGSQALGLQAAQGGFVELVFPEAGHYPVVSHIMSDAERGAHGIVEVTD
ncbi:MAG: multicopper oxidase domain-containing protein, partial [Brooklawnia sp.]|nr:multicopper oxidase domain-containing protein [Brooklawnia sp.]